jgi:hypothetical protein
MRKEICRKRAKNNLNSDLEGNIVDFGQKKALTECGWVSTMCTQKKLSKLGSNVQFSYHKMRNSNTHMKSYAQFTA